MPARDDDDLRIEVEGGGARRVLKQILGVWAVGYPILSILPLLSSGTGSAGSTAAGAFASLIVGSVLFGPWIIEIIVLGVLVLVSPAPTPVIRRRFISDDEGAAGLPFSYHPPAKAAGPLEWNPESRDWEPARQRAPKRPAESEYADAGYWKPGPSRRQLLTRLTRIGYIDPPDDESVAARPPTLDPKRHR